MDSNSSSPSWDEAPTAAYDRNNVIAQKDLLDKISSKEDKDMSFPEDSDASSVIVKTVKRKPKRISKT